MTSEDEKKLSETVNLLIEHVSTLSALVKASANGRSEDMEELMVVLKTIDFNSLERHLSDFHEYHKNISIHNDQISRVVSLVDEFIERVSENEYIKISSKDVIYTMADKFSVGYKQLSERKKNESLRFYGKWAVGVLGGAALLWTIGVLITKLSTTIKLLSQVPS
jgi:hypothetical protein